MRNLANSILDYLCFLTFCEEEECDPDYTLKLLEGLSWDIQNNYSEEEKQALTEAASRRLEDRLVNAQQKQLLEAISGGKFDGYEVDDGSM